MVYEQWSVVKEDGDAYSSPTDALYPLNFFSQMLLRPPPNLSSIFLFLGVYVQKPLARLEQPTTRLRRVLDSRSVIRIFILENFILGSPSGLILDKGRYDRIDQSSKRTSIRIPRPRILSAPSSERKREKRDVSSLRDIYENVLYRENN